MAKRPGSLVLTFSRKNMDIRRLLESKKIHNESFIATDYICESIRFYEKYKDSVEFNNLETVKKLIDDRLKEFIKTNKNSTVTFGLAENEGVAEKKSIINEIETNIDALESNLEDIPIDED
ncbi:hypothetical protein HBE96_05330 [Clostridium sp. P21]|uniref:Uncharacterized protein n=1 Tax=Clostridium muellerianum TaxID=2716538 RepID=A0A7Y0HMZ2_9CLOT|nr:hypothetical protein [Clostridium muellerianum]NMM62117.1 hypothetical protein [Clostridium muellerianum]